MTRRRARGTSLVELLVGTGLALLVFSALTAAVGTGARLLIACGARGEAEDTAQLALEAFTFDVRRAGWDPAASGLVAVREADTDRLVLAADLDGDGAVDGASERPRRTSASRARGASRASSAASRCRSPTA